MSLPVPFQHRVPSVQRAPSAARIESSPGNHLPAPERGVVVALRPAVLMFVHVHEQSRLGPSDDERESIEDGRQDDAPKQDAEEIPLGEKDVAEQQDQAKRLKKE